MWAAFLDSPESWPTGNVNRWSGALRRVSYKAKGRAIVAVNALGEAYITTMKKLFSEGILAKHDTPKEIKLTIIAELTKVIEAARQQLTSLNLQGPSSAVMGAP
jgi:hypothetical protein